MFSFARVHLYKPTQTKHVFVMNLDQMNGKSCLGLDGELVKAIVFQEANQQLSAPLILLHHAQMRNLLVTGRARDSCLIEELDQNVSSKSQEFRVCRLTVHGLPERGDHLTILTVVANSSVICRCHILRSLLQQIGASNLEEHENILTNSRCTLSRFHGCRYHC